MLGRRSKLARRFNPAPCSRISRPRNWSWSKEGREDSECRSALRKLSARDTPEGDSATDCKYSVRLLTLLSVQGAWSSWSESISREMLEVPGSLRLEPEGALLLDGGGSLPPVFARCNASFFFMASLTCLAYTPRSSMSMEDSFSREWSVSARARVRDPLEGGAAVGSSGAGGCPNPVCLRDSNLAACFTREGRLVKVGGAVLALGSWPPSLSGVAWAPSASARSGSASGLGSYA
mmetsp:Transcript_37294/g.70041  ORF Transcript_37294/g.70041 Transcript_37294/m.70041 type:complete len:235 (-) Transcript_37294:637-1341(-)